MNVSPKTLTADFVQSFIEENYGIVSDKPPKPEGEGIENAAWIFSTDSQNYIVKIFDASATIENDVNEEVLLYDYLREHDINTPEVIPNQSFKKVSIIETGGLRFPTIVMVFEGLKRYTASELSKEQLEKIASTVSRMHKVLMDYPRKSHIRQSSYDAESIHTHSMKDFEMFLTSPNAKSSYLHDHDRLRKIRKDAINFLNRQTIETNLTRTVLHNDLALGHLLFLPSDEIYIFDFSDFEYGSVALDLGVLFFNFYREGELSMKKWRSMIDDFLAVYTQTVPLTENDKKAIDIFTVSRLLEHVRYLDERSIKENHMMDDKGIKKRYDLLEQLYLAGSL